MALHHIEQNCISTIKGRTFELQAMFGELNFHCKGCTAEGDTTLCHALPECVLYPSPKASRGMPMIWVERKSA